LLQKCHLIGLTMQPLGIGEQSIQVKDQRAESHVLAVPRAPILLEFDFMIQPSRRD
jgi:hypothetical protein